MIRENADPVAPWHSLSDWYAEFASTPNWGFLAPMVELTAWVEDQPIAAKLYFLTSHEWLCLSFHIGYDPDLPFFACCSRGDGLFECNLWASVGKLLYRNVYPLSQAREAFMEFVVRLKAVA